MAAEGRVRDYVTLQRGTTYKGNLVGKPGPALLGLGSINPGGGFREGDYKSYGGDCPKRLMLHPGDLFVSLKGATKDGKMIGSVARVPASVSSGRLTQDTVKLEFRCRDRSTENFLYWLLRTPQYRDYCEGRATGSAVVALSRYDFLEYPVPVMTEVVTRLVDLLEAIEEKIELNRRMNATLEAMARALFQSWFIDFNPVRAKLDGLVLGGDPATVFPAHLEYTTTGVVPAGWRVTALGDVVEILDSKRIPLSARERSLRQGKYPYHGAAAVMDYVDDYLFDGIHVLMGEDGSVINEDGTPVLQYVWGKFWVNNHAHVLRGKNGVSSEHLLLHLKGCNIGAFVNGAVQAKLNQGNMNKIPFLLPSLEVCNAFKGTIDPLFAKIRANSEQSRTLTTLRDTLLPNLLSGELRVSAVTAQLQAAI